jgi:cell wall-associated NlpC family hydrolase
VSDRLSLHTPDPPDVLGVQVQVISASAATISLTATLEWPAIPADGSSYPAHLTFEVPPGADSVYVMPGGFTVAPDTAPGSQACVRLQWTFLPNDVRSARGCATVVGAGGQLPSTATPPSSPTPPTAPSYLAALAALTRQGARYSQGGAHPADPIDAATGEPYPRTGPNSFDCSGLVWWSYAQAGVAIGQTTLAQLNDGVALPCTLDDLQGAATRCWTLGDLIFLSYSGGRHVAIYVGQGLFMDCYNHETGCILHDVSRDTFYRAHFLEARRIVSGCEGLTIDPGQPIPSPPIGDPENDLICAPDGPNWTDSGVGYSRGCGPPALPPVLDGAEGTSLRQFTGVLGWLGDTGRFWPPGAAGAHLHLGVDVGTTTDVCRWPYQPPNAPPGEPPPGGAQCMTSWADPLQFLPQANADSLQSTAGTPAPVAAGQRGDTTYDSALMQLPPPGHPAGLLYPAQEDAAPGGTWWSPGNDDRAGNARCPLGGPRTTSWLGWVLELLFPWWFGC